MKLIAAHEKKHDTANPRLCQTVKGVYCTHSSGDHVFEFRVSRNTEKSVTLHTYEVLVTQTTSFSKEEQALFGMEKSEITYKIVAPYSKTETSAINYAGKKLIKDWKNKN